MGSIDLNGFDRPGFQNTDDVIEIAARGAKELGIGYVVVASTVGATGLKAAQKFAGSGVEVVVVTHNVGFGKAGNWEMDGDTVAQIELFGAKIHKGTMVLRGLGCAVRSMSGGYSEEQIVAQTLRMFGEGTKVCLEIAAMAADAGLIPCERVICIAGTARGADTCLVVKANNSNRFFDMKVLDVLAKPACFDKKS